MPTFELSITNDSQAPEIDCFTPSLAHLEEAPRMRVVIACGGTGGHLFPGLAVGEVLRERGHDVLVFISEKQIDAVATQGRTEFQYEKLPGVGMPRLWSPAVVPFLWRMKASVDRCREIYRRFTPDAVLGMGGFTSTPPIIAGRLRSVPTFLHESNAIPGKANRLNGRLSTRVLIGFKECSGFFPSGKCEFTGTPIRRELTGQVDRRAALAAFGLGEERRTLLVMGGSQGAHGINEAVIKALPLLRDRPLQFIHLTGAGDEQLVQAGYRQENVPAYVAAFHHRMQEAYGLADFAIARSGAASLTELGYFGLPSILIPFPFAAEDHQTKNAEIFARADAAVALQQKAATGEVLAQRVIEFLESPERLKKMSENCRQLVPADAANRVANTIETYVHERNTTHTR